MRTARWLSGIWVLCMLASVLTIFIWMMVEGVKIPSEIIAWIIVWAIFGILTAGLYGLNYRVLSRNSNYFVLKSIYPAICPNLYILPYAIYVINNWGDWSDHDFPRFGMIAWTILLLVILGFTLFGWIRRRPGTFIAALVTAGIMVPMLCLASTLYYSWNDPHFFAFIDVYLYIMLIFVALPALWMALACFFATLSAPPRLDAASRNKTLLMLSSLDEQASVNASGEERTS